MGYLSGKIILVSGVSRGIGASIARELSQRGAHVIAQYNTSAVAPTMPPPPSRSDFWSPLISLTRPHMTSKRQTSTNVGHEKFRFYEDVRHRSYSQRFPLLTRPNASSRSRPGTASR
ncbi:hypothetical protein FB472_1380 [Rhodoglobus vestalii]|uniref:Short subunit dehydrogenase n=1 Tax=Rhodoglobus vestalii TaxID=193384 RepID=A0A8H2K845_9MICO|nr:hypothetical protein FB472_1380 [Rhodoglobus vestalii]